MKKLLYILVLISMCSCAVSSRFSANKYHTAEVKNATITLQQDKNVFTLHMHTQTVVDSICILSIQAFPGIEAVQIRADRDSVMIIDRMGRNFTCLSYTELSQWVQPTIGYTDIERIAIGAHLRKRQDQFTTQFQYLGTCINCTLTYPSIALDQALKLREQRTKGYASIPSNKIEQLLGL